MMKPIIAAEPARVNSPLFPSSGERPHNLEVEQALLGAILIDPDAIHAAASVQPEDFYFAEHSEIFAAMRVLTSEGRGITPLTLGPLLRNVPTPFDGRKYLARLVLEATSSLNTRDYALTVGEYAARRRLADLGASLTAMASDVSFSPVAAAGDAVQVLDEIIVASRPNKSRKSSLADAASEALDAFKEGGGSAGMTTGLRDLDSALGGGWHRGELVIVGARPSMGKAQPLDALVLMESGKWKAMGELSIGDRIASVDGSPSTVCGVFDRGERQVYKFTFSDGRTCEACGDHLWEINYRQWSSPRVVSTNDIIKLLKKKRYKKRISIRLMSGAFGEDGPHLPIDPWVLGVLLGDGSLLSGIRFITTSQHVVDNLKSKLVNGIDVKWDGLDGSIVGETRGGNSVLDGIKELGLYKLRGHEKFIPKLYKEGSRETRLEVIKGLLDTDGWVEKFGAMLYSSSSEVLANDFLGIVRSLGYWATIKRKAASYSKDGVRHECRDAFVVCISGKGKSELISRPERHRRVENKAVRSRALTIVDVAPSRVTETRCITVTHPSQLYITNDYIVTHNSAFATTTARLTARAGNGVLFFSLEMTKQMVAARAISDQIWNSQTPLPYEQIRRWDIHGDEQRLRDAVERFRSHPFMIDDQFGLTMAEIASRCRQQAIAFEKRGQRLDLVVVDHLGKIKASDRYAGNRVHETGEKTNALLGLCKDLDVSVLALHQLNRGVEGRENKRPDLSDLRDSGNIEEDAHTVGFLYRPAYYLERTRHDDDEKEEKRMELLEKKKNVLEFIISKNRNGPCDTVESFIDIGNNSIRDFRR